MDSDDRFKHLANDPRFRTFRKKQRKVVVDERFKSMFNEDKFKLDDNHNKRGLNQSNKSRNDLKRYYSLESEDNLGEVVKEQVRKNPVLSDSEKAPAILELENTSDDDNDDQVDPMVEDYSSSSSSSSDEADTEEEDETFASAVIDYDWQPLDHDAETGDTTTKRLAIQNLDWDSLDVKDLYTLVNSVRRPIKVSIYISEFGKERLRDEMKNGPTELVQNEGLDEEEEDFNKLQQKIRELKNPQLRKTRINEYEDADEAFNLKDDTVRAKVRRYQLNKMKYYYAIAEFDSVESAQVVYKELDGLEYEGSSLELDLRFVPDDVDFDQDDLKAECDHEPDVNTYKAPQFINSALQQTKVRFTWDETDNKRQQQLRRAYNKQELEKDDLEVYLASDSDNSTNTEIAEDYCNEDEFVTTNRADKYKELLQSLEKEQKKKDDIDIEWGNFEQEDQQHFRETSSNCRSGELEGEPEGEDDLYTDRKKPNVPKKTKKLLSQNKTHQESDDQPELSLIVMNDSTGHGEFKFNPDDERFKAVYESGIYNIDPSYPKFKPSEAFEAMAVKKRTKRAKI